MTGNVRDIVRKRAQGKCVLVRILALRQQLSDKVATANVMHQITEFHAAKWVVTEVLNHGASISVTVPP